LHPALVGLFATVVAIAAVALSYAVQGFSCGREADEGYAIAAPFLMAIFTFGLIYIVPGVFIGGLATIVDWLRWPLVWIPAASTLCGALAICFALEGASPGGLPPVLCRIDL
jgi:hypothetical protein